MFFDILSIANRVPVIFSDSGIASILRLPSNFLLQESRNQEQHAPAILQSGGVLHLPFV